MNHKSNVFRDHIWGTGADHYCMSVPYCMDVPDLYQRHF